MPRRTRPARPRRCRAEARETWVSTNMGILFWSSYWFSLTLPASITYTTSSMGGHDKVRKTGDGLTARNTEQMNGPRVKRMVH